MIEKDIKKTLIVDGKNLKFIDNYRCAELDEDTFTGKVNDVITYMSELHKVGLGLFSDRFSKKELAYIFISCLNSSIYYRISAREFLINEITDYNNYEMEYTDELDSLLCKIRQLSNVEALVLYSLAKQCVYKEDGSCTTIFPMK